MLTPPLLPHSLAPKIVDRIGPVPNPNLPTVVGYDPVTFTGLNMIPTLFAANALRNEITVGPFPSDDELINDGAHCTAPPKVVNVQVLTVDTTK